MGIGLLSVALGVGGRAAAAPIGGPDVADPVPCADPEPIVAALEAAATEGRLADARAAKDKVLAAFGCRLADPGLLARVWLADAVVLATEGDDTGSSDALAAAARAEPGAWRDVYGSEFRRRFEEARVAEAPVGRLVLTVEPATDAPHTLAIDGHPSDPAPVELPSGLHLAQAGYGEDVRFARELYVVAGQDLMVGATLGPPPRPAAVTAPEPALVASTDPALAPAGDPLIVTPLPPEPRPFPTLLALGGVTGTAAVGAAIGAVLQNGAMRNASDLATLDAAYRQQRALGATSYVLLGLTAALVGLEIAW